MNADASLKAPAASATDAAGRPWTLTAGAAIALLQGGLIAAYGVYMMIEGLVTHTRTGLGLTEFGGFIVLLLGLLPLLSGRALLRVKRWGRSPAVLVDTLCLAVTYFMVQNGGLQIALGTLIGLAGVSGLVLLLHPRTTAVLWPTGGRR